jgi:hypothetical protein
LENHSRLAPKFRRIVRPDWNQEFWFIPAGAYSGSPPSAPPAVLVFAYSGSDIVLANIAGRGLTIPSGRVDAGETAAQAAVRETYEETGGHIRAGSLTLIGYHAFVPLSGELKGQTILCPTYMADIESFDPIPAGSESNSVITVDPDKIESCYFMWDDLIKDLFEFVATERASGKNNGSI